MLHSLVEELGAWSWWLLGLALLAAELVMPGVFLVWIGAAAITIGILSLLLWETSFWVWQLQFLLFAALAVGFTFAGRLLSGSDHVTDEPLLNQRAASLVGRTSILQEPISEGRGRIRLDDTFWPVMGPDLPAGTRVKVTASHGRDLTVDAA